LPNPGRINSLCPGRGAAARWAEPALPQGVEHSPKVANLGKGFPVPNSVMPQGIQHSLMVADLGKDYPTRSGPLTVLRNVNLGLQRGQALAVMGPSGSGKSTLLHILGTLDQPTHGSVRLEGTDPFTLPERALADFRNRHIGFVFQDHHLLPQCSVLENVLIPTLVQRADSAEVVARARSLLERVGLADRVEHRPAELSGGERQRVAVARALIHRPALLLADEPTGNLDRRTAQAVGRLLLELHREENSILVVVTHSQELADTFPSVLEMQDGELRPPAGRHPSAESGS
jgi:lipoprotein-releasing system ATP-binding protein